MSNVIAQHKWAKEKLIRDIMTYLSGGPDLETLHRAYLGWHCGFSDDLIKEAWASARAERNRLLEKHGA
jgi:hypothetical protein